jgi:hypothetical protein
MCHFDTVLHMKRPSVPPTSRQRKRQRETKDNKHYITASYYAHT